MPVPLLGHVDVVVSSLGRSLPFYRELLGPLGIDSEREMEGERGERIIYFSGEGYLGALGLREKQSDAHPVPYDRYGVGLHHVALLVRSREQIDERADWLRRHGAEIESGPREYDYKPGYYAVFFYDPDGIKLELFHWPR